MKVERIWLIGLVFLFLVPIVAGVTVNPTSESYTIYAGSSETESFDFTFVNENCSLSLSIIPSSWVNPMPVFNNVTGTIKFPLTITAPSNVPTYSYNGTLKCSDAIASIDLHVIGTGEAFKRVMLTILGSTERGKSMNFDVRDIDTYKWLDSDIFVSLSDGLTIEVPCTFLSCSYLVSPTEPGPIVVKVLPRDTAYLPISKQVELSGTLEENKTETEIGGGEITITGPTEAYLGESYQFLIIARSKPLQWVNIQVVGPDYAQSFTTNSYGICVDSANLVFGTEVKPSEIGDYTMFISREGYAPAEFSFSVVRKQCPFDCCPGNGYGAKACPSDFHCVDNSCEPIEIPKITIKCSPENVEYNKVVSCSILDPTGKKISESVTGKLTTSDGETNIIFAEGTSNFTADSIGKYSVQIPDCLGFEGGSYVGAVVTPTISLDWLWPWGAVFFIIIIIILLIIVVLKMRGRGPKIGYPPSEAEFEEVVEA